MRITADVVVDKEATESSNVVAILLGIASLITAIFAPLAISYGQAMFLPILSFITGVISYFLLNRNSSNSFMKSLLVAACSVSGLAGAWSLTETKMRNDIYYQQAGTIAEEWLTIVSSGNRELAFEMTINEGYRQLETMDLAKYYNSDMNARSALELFYSKPAMKAAQRRGADAKWKYLSPRGIIKSQLGDLVKVAVRDTSGARPVTIIVSIMRNTKETNDPKLACWHVLEAEIET